MASLSRNRRHGDGRAEEGRRVLAGVLRHVREAAAAQRALPGEIELAERLGCSRKQVRDALATLEQQGIVLRRQGAATVIDPVALRMSVRFEDQLEYSLLLSRLGYEPATETLSVGEISTPPELAALLMTEAGAPAARILKRWRADGHVAMVARTTLALPADPVRVDLSQSIYAVSREVWGESVIWEVTTPAAVSLPEQDAELFERPAGTPVLGLEIIGIALTGPRLFHASEMHDPSVVSYSVTRTVRPPRVFSTARYQLTQAHDKLTSALTRPARQEKMPLDWARQV
jgi:DNA-binding GntR family transcriptional regulator